jgi:hypothetical protein
MLEPDGKTASLKRGSMQISRFSRVSRLLIGLSGPAIFSSIFTIIGAITGLLTGIILYDRNMKSSHN